MVVNICGIVGCILKENGGNAAPILFDCISKLEFRDYDSIGWAATKTYVPANCNIPIRSTNGKRRKTSQRTQQST